MTLRDRMIYAGLRTSKKFAKLTWRERDFFQGLLHVADDFGRFEQDAETLRTVLYGPLLAKVGVRDVAEMLIRVYQVDLVKLYTVRGRGFGKVINFRQNGLKTRRALYPDEDGEEPELFGSAAPPGDKPKPPPKEGKKETPHSPPPAGGGDADAFLDKAAKPARFRRAQRLDTLVDEQERIAREITDILRPGGCAYNVQPPEGSEKAKRLEGLFSALDKVQQAIAKRRDELARE